MYRFTSNVLRRSCNTRLSLVQQATRRGMSSQTQATAAGSSGTAKYFVIGALTACAATMIALNQNLPSSDSGFSLQQQVNDLQVTVSGKTNSAFVFIKPHACNDKVQDLVKEHFKRNGINVTGEGSLDAKTIDEKLLIDTHYGAIASKAVKLTPAELHVPDKGKADFKKLFGESWDDAVKTGKVLNAKQAAEKLGMNGAELEKIWRSAKPGVSLVKFGGGFYCGKIKDDLYVMNGFYMNMRSAYTTPPAKIHYFTVQWPTDTLSWEAFRQDILGATNPTTAQEGSVRRIIYSNWQKLGLDHEPNTGDNGVHASASPFEALSERNNWLGQDITTDAYGKGLIAAGIDVETIKEYAQDPQVSFEGKKGSLFDYLEDLSADECLQRLTQFK